jgi:hypothetical protein
MTHKNRKKIEIFHVFRDWMQGQFLSVIFARLVRDPDPQFECGSETLIKTKD